MASINLNVRDGMRAHLEEALETRRANIGRGLTKDWADYKEQVGYVTCLQDCLTVLEDINRKIMGS